jgi:transposase
VLGMVHQRTTESTKQLLHQNVMSKESVKTVEKSRFLLLKGYEKLTDDQKKKLSEILEEYPNLTCAYYLKEILREFYKLKVYDDALKFLEEWIQLAWSSPYGRLKTGKPKSFNTSFLHIQMEEQKGPTTK